MRRAGEFSAPQAVWDYYAQLKNFHAVASHSFLPVALRGSQLEIVARENLEKI
jgi:hypothetical protein